MSSYVINQATMQAITTRITSAEEAQGHHLQAARDRLRKIADERRTYTGRSELTHQEALGQMLSELNQVAVNQRYRVEGESPQYEHKHRPASDAVAVRLIEGLIYQLSEGDVPDTRLYKLLAHYHKALLTDMVSHAYPEYREAGWEVNA